MYDIGDSICNLLSSKNFINSILIHPTLPLFLSYVLKLLEYFSNVFYVYIQVRLWVYYKTKTVKTHFMITKDYYIISQIIHYHKHTGYSMSH